MMCRKIRKLMPLAAGGDLRPRLAAAFEAHVDACPGCRAELDRFRADWAAIKAAAKAESVPDWGEAEWRAAMAHATTGAWPAGETAVREGGLPLRPRWAAAAALGALSALVVLSVLFRGPAPRPGRAAGGFSPVVVSAAPPQDRVAITMVSPETGLQIVWFLDKNFEWKGDQE